MFAEIWHITTDGIPCVSGVMSVADLHPADAHSEGEAILLMWARVRGLDDTHVLRLLRKAPTYVHSRVIAVGAVLVGNNININMMWADKASWHGAPVPIQWASA